MMINDDTYMESTKRFLSVLFFSFFILRREVLTRLIEASIIDEKQFILNMKFYG